MQAEISSAITYNSCEAVTSSSPFVSQSNGHGYDFSSIFFSPPNSPLLDDIDEYSSISTASQPMLTSGSPYSAPSYHQDLVDGHRALLSRLREVFEQAQALRRENISLKMINVELNNQLSLLLNAASFAGFNDDSDSMVEGVRNVCVGGGETEARENHLPGYDDAATVESSGGKVDGVLLPKSISVRSSGYLKAVQGAGSSRRRAKTNNAAQRVYVQGTKEEQPLELEVYNQGMFKTELCNKWQQTGTCPYGDNCQFAHGIEELRPVLRHPRYKTEVCRMVINGEPCPYGHRCHFRHTLTDQEKLMRSINDRSLKSPNR